MAQEGCRVSSRTWFPSPQSHVCLFSEDPFSLPGLTLLLSVPSFVVPCWLQEGDLELPSIWALLDSLASPGPSLSKQGEAELRAGILTSGWPSRTPSKPTSCFRTLRLGVGPVVFAGESGAHQLDPLLWASVLPSAA